MVRVPSQSDSILGANSTILGVGAITQMRLIETQRYDEDLTADKDGASQPSGLSSLKRSKIFALSGLASNEDKLRAFNAGVDG